MTTFNKKLIGTAQRPRVSVFRSNRFISAQLINDETGVTILSYSSQSIKEKMKPVEKAVATGKKIAELAKAKKITSAVYDRGVYRYHGSVKALAEGIRQGGLQL